MTPTTNSVRIVWETHEDALNKSIVEYGTTPKLGTCTHGAAGWSIVGEGNMHEIILKGLKPFTTYYYRAGDGDTFSEIYETKTAPLPGTSFRLMSVSDIHNNSGHVWENLSKKVMADSIDMTVFIGDLINNGSLRSEWDSGFFMPGRPLLSKCVITGSIGNHETAFGATTYYDYFSLPIHYENDDNPEAYFEMDYGDLKIIAININDDKYSPKFSPGSPQLLWLENEIKNSNTKWIFIFSHVNILSTGYHGQWSEHQKDYVMPLLEKYAILGKNIICFGGDEHNFEHLYKNGVNYIRPGAANAIVRGQFNMSDSPYSIYFKKTAGYSIIDVSDNGKVVTLSAKDSSGKVFYRVRFTVGPKAFIKEQERPDDIHIY